MGDSDFERPLSSTKLFKLLILRGEKKRDGYATATTRVYPARPREDGGKKTGMHGGDTTYLAAVRLEDVCHLFLVSLLVSSCHLGNI